MTDYLSSALNSLLLWVAMPAWAQIMAIAITFLAIYWMLDCWRRHD